MTKYLPTQFETKNPRDLLLRVRIQHPVRDRSHKGTGRRCSSGARAAVGAGLAVTTAAHLRIRGMDPTIPHAEILEPFHEWRHGDVRYAVMAAREPLVSFERGIHSGDDGAEGMRGFPDYGDVGNAARGVSEAGRTPCRGVVRAAPRVRLAASAPAAAGRGVRSSPAGSLDVRGRRKSSATYALAHANTGRAASGRLGERLVQVLADHRTRPRPCRHARASAPRHSD